MQTLLEQILNGLIAGSMYAVVSAGLALTIGVLRVVNFAHGDLFMVGAYIFYGIYVALKVPYALAAILTIAAVAGFGLLFQQVVIRPVLGRSWQVQMIATIAASVIINNGVIWLLGTTPRTTPTTLSRKLIHVAGFTLSWQRVLILVCTALTFWGLYLLLKYTRLGKAMRAVSQNREAAESAGIDVHRVATATFLVGSSLIGLGNVLVTPVYSVFPAMGALFTVKAFAVMVVGGFGRVGGAVAAALLLGIAEALGTGYVSSGYTDAFAFVAMILVLLLRPHGLFGRKVGI